MKTGILGVSLLLSTAAFAADPLMPSGGDDTAAIQTAIDNAPEGGTVTLGDGLFILTDEILVARHVTVKSEHGRDFTQIKQTAGSSTNMFRALHINHPQAIVDGFAICNSGAQKLSSNDKGYIPGAGVYVDVQGGRLVSCIISNCNALTLGSVNLASSVAVMSNCIIRANVSTPNRALNYNTTAGLEMSAGLVTHCTIDNNVMQKGNYGSCLGAGACLKGGRLSYCFVTNNSITVSKSEGSRGGGVYVSSGSPIVDNCLISGNATQKEGGGVYAAAVGYFTNCTIVANTAKGGSGGIHVAANKAPVFYGCIIQDNVNASGYSDVSSAKASFPCSVTDGGVEFDGGGYVPVFGSAAIDACPVADYAKDMSGAIDLAGRPRLSGGAVDAGAFEYQYPDFIASVAFLSDSVLPPGDTFSFTGKVVCTDASLVRYGWSIDGGDAEWTANALYSVSDLPAGVHTLTLSVKYDDVDKGEAGTLGFLVTYPDVYVVDPKLHSGHVAVYPYATESGAATSLVEAVACARRGTTVHVGPGVHDIDVPLEPVGAVKLVSTDGREATVIRQVATGGTQNRCVHLNDEGALLDGFALTGAKGDPYGIAACIDVNGGVVRNCIATNNQTGADGGTLAVLSANGVISNCVVRWNRAMSGNTSAGPVGLYMNSGLVACCDISCNTNSTGFTYGGNSGVGAIVSGGRLTRCTVCDNASTKSTNNGAGGKGSGVWITGTSAVVDNCLIARNYTIESRGGVAFEAAGTLLNCTVVDNVVPSADVTAHSAGVFTDKYSAGKVVNTVIQGNVTTEGEASECTLNRALVYTRSLCAAAELPADKGNISEAAIFKGEGDYHLDQESPGIRVGRVTGYEDYLVGGVDLDGNRRATSRGKTDVGCYQSNIGLMLLVK